MEAPAPRGGHWTGAPPPPDRRPRPWSDRLSAGLLDDLQAWNDSWDTGQDRWKDGEATVRTLQEQGRELATRVQDELGTDGWEVLYRLGDRMFRVHPPGSWPARTWEQELLGYAPRDGQDTEAEGQGPAGGP
jgi:hypothetical protein